MLRPALLALGLIACPVLAEDIRVFDPELGPDYPPLMGTMSGTMGGVPVAWETYDFSVGAFDASAWAEADYDSGIVGVHIMAYPPGEPETMAGRINATAAFGRALKTGKGRNVEVAIQKGDDIDGPRLSSEGQTAVFVIDSIGPKVEDSYSRRVTGHIEATLCPVDWAEQACQDIVLTFDTDMQMGSELKVRD